MGAPLKQWMRNEDIYDNDLYEILGSFNVRDAPTDFKKISQPKWDEIWRRGKVERIKQLKDQKSRNRLDKKMKKLEKVWRKESGINMTSIQENVRERHKNTKTKKKKKNIKNRDKRQPKTRKKGKNRVSTPSSLHSDKSTKTKKKKPAPEHGKKKKGRDLKVWMQKNGCFENTLYKE